MSKKYATYAEAKEAAKLLGFNSVTSYHAGYKQDPRLYVNPDQMLEGWVDWYDYLGNERPINKYYSTYCEARKAARSLGFRTSTGYMAEYEKDPKLPSTPSQIYEDWVDWYDYLGKVRPSSKYSSYTEAREAVKSIKIKNQDDYKERYREDPKLSSNPERTLNGWVNWFDFLGKEQPSSKYSSYKEARKAARSLNFKNQEEYIANYKKDPRLYSSPDKMFEDWIDWYDYLGNERPIFRFYSTHEDARKATQFLG